MSLANASTRQDQQRQAHNVANDSAAGNMPLPHEQQNMPPMGGTPHVASASKKRKINPSSISSASRCEAGAREGEAIGMQNVFGMAHRVREWDLFQQANDSIAHHEIGASAGTSHHTTISNVKTGQHHSAHQQPQYHLLTKYASSSDDDTLTFSPRRLQRLSDAYSKYPANWERILNEYDWGDASDRQLRKVWVQRVRRNVSREDGSHSTLQHTPQHPQHPSLLSESQPQHPSFPLIDKHALTLAINQYGENYRLISQNALSQYSPDVLRARWHYMVASGQVQLRSNPSIRPASPPKKQKRSKSASQGATKSRAPLAKSKSSSKSSKRRKRIASPLLKEKSCATCGITETPLWRYADNKKLCNRCGIYFQRNGMHRPVDLRKKRKRGSKLVMSQDSEELDEHEDLVGASPPLQRKKVDPDEYYPPPPMQKRQNPYVVAPQSYHAIPPPQVQVQSVRHQPPQQQQYSSPPYYTAAPAPPLAPSQSILPSIAELKSRITRAGSHSTITGDDLSGDAASIDSGSHTVRSREGTSPRGIIGQHGYSVTTTGGGHFEAPPVSQYQQPPMQCAAEPRISAGYGVSVSQLMHEDISLQTPPQQQSLYASPKPSAPSPLAQQYGHHYAPPQQQQQHHVHNARYVPVQVSPHAHSMSATHHYSANPQPQQIAPPQYWEHQNHQQHHSYHSSAPQWSSHVSSTQYHTDTGHWRGSQ